MTEHWSDRLSLPALVALSVGVVGAVGAVIGGAVVLVLSKLDDIDLDELTS